MKNNIFIFLCIYSLTFVNAQTQIGSNLYGDAEEDWFGRSVSMPDANTLAIGAPQNDLNGLNAGQVRVYNWNGNSWIQKGQDILGVSVGDFFGYWISMPDSNTVGVGAPYNDLNGLDAGQVRVFNWNGTAWVQKGQALNGETSQNWFGWAVSMPDPNTLASGGPAFPGGYVKIHSWDGTAWVQKGEDLIGENIQDASGWSLSMPDANTIAIGAIGYYQNPFSGQVRIYNWIENAWIQKGTDIFGESGDNFARSVSMPDANTIAIGAPLYGEGIENTGRVFIYQWNGTSWVQKGLNIIGKPESLSGWSVSMPDANTVAIGAPNDDSNGLYSGQVRVYGWNGTAWEQKGIDINGELPEGDSGRSVSMPNANTLAIGEPLNDFIGFNAGNARVFEGFAALGLEDFELNNPNFKMYPNPAQNTIFIELTNIDDSLHSIEFYDFKGSLIKKSIHFSDKSTHLIDISSLPSSTYLIKIETNRGINFTKLIKD